MVLDKKFSLITCRKRFMTVCDWITKNKLSVLWDGNFLKISSCEQNPQRLLSYCGVRKLRVFRTLSSNTTSIQNAEFATQNQVLQEFEVLCCFLLQIPYRLLLLIVSLLLLVAEILSALNLLDITSNFPIIFIFIIF
jgi:hypothetical protein